MKSIKHVEDKIMAKRTGKMRFWGVQEYWESGNNQNSLYLTVAQSLLDSSTNQPFNKILQVYTFLGPSVN